MDELMVYKSRKLVNYKYCVHIRLKKIKKRCLLFFDCANIRLIG